MFENYQNCLKTTQLDNKINYNEKVKLTQYKMYKKNIATI